MKDDFIEVTRVIKYTGTKEWIDSTLSRGLIPSGNGEVEFANGSRISSLIVPCYICPQVEDDYEQQVGDDYMAHMDCYG